MRFRTLAKYDYSAYEYLMNQDINVSRQKTKPDTTRSVTDAVRENQAATDVFDEVLSQFLGINRTDARCLDIIDRHGKMSAGQLANESGLTTGAVTAVVDRLEAAGYVHRLRDTLDRRKVWVEPSESMRTITNHIFGFYASFGPLIQQRFTPEQLAGIMEFLVIGKVMSLEMAAGLREHLDASATTADMRLKQARAFERAMRANAERLNAEVDAVRFDPEDFA